ncbi:MAG: outer membrane protein assembly factor BamA [Paracoccaceae bacterium]
MRAESGVRWVSAATAVAFALGIFVTVLSGLAGPASAQSGPPLGAIAVPNGTQASGVIIRGNRRIERGTILSYMELPGDRSITSEDLNLAVRRLFETGLFQDVRVTPQGDQLIVDVVENPSINEVAFEGNDALSDDDLRQIVSARPRFPFTAAAAEADAQAIINVYRRTGRFGAQVVPVIIERSDNRVDLVFEIEEGEPTGVNSIDFVGNEAFSDSRLRDEIETSESGFFAQFFSSDIYDPDRIELDRALLRQFYLSRGYADFTILSSTTELAPDRSGFFITFTVEEGPQYSFGTFDVVVNAEGLDPADFLAAIPMDELTGEVYNANEVEELANTLTDLAGEKGFAFVQVRPRADKDDENLIIDITFELAEGNRIFIERIDIQGNTATLDRVIRREIELVEGDPFDARKIRRARRAIRGLGYFSRVEVEPEEGSADDRAVLRVEVEERSTGSISFGLGFSSSVGPIGSISVTERNFLGRGQVVSARVTAAGDTQVYDFAFTEPRFLDRDLSVGARTFFIQDDRDDESSFTLNRAGFEPQVGFPLADDTDLTLRYTFARDEVDAAEDASPAIQIDDGARFKSSFGYVLTYDQRDDPIEPTGGYLATIDQEIAGAGGDARFVRSRARIKTWRGFLNDDVIASVELEAGSLFTFGEDSQVNDRFFLGSDTFRGFADEGLGPRDFNTDDAIGGNFFGVARFEVSFPLGLPEELGVFGGAFVDVGTLFGLDRTSFDAAGDAPAVSIDDDPKLRLAAGGLLFVETPFGPLELSVGVPIIDEEGDEDELFRISVGTRF